MASLAFKNWVVSERHTQFSLLSQLRTCRIAIDGLDYLYTLLCSSPTKEPLLPALGGLPFALEHHLKAELEHFRNADITPIFVFDGIDLACKDRRTVAKGSSRALNVLNNAWALYNQTRAPEAVEEFGRSCAYKTYHIRRWLQAFLYQNGVHTLVAPYTAAAQMIQMEKERLVEALVGSANLLVSGADQIITSFDWEAKHFHWFYPEDLCTKLRISQHQLVDAVLLSGSSLLPPLAEVEDSLAPKMQAAISQLRAINFDVNTLRSKDEEYLKLWQKARAAIQHCVLITKTGKIEPLNSATMPGDGHEFLSQQLPPELIFYLSTGIVGPRLLNWRVRSEIFETPPLDGGSSTFYHDFVQDKLAPLRAQALAVITPPLHRYYHRRDVNLVTWYNEGQTRPLGIPDLTESVTGKFDNWKCKDADVITAFLAEQNPIQAAISVLSQESLAAKTKTASAQPLVSSKQLIFSTVGRFLQDRGYVSASEHTLTARGRALKAAIDDGGPDTTDAVLTAFELLRTDSLSEKEMFPTSLYTGAPSRGSTVDKQRSLLVSRVACLGHLRHKSIGYTGPLSRHLLAYQQVCSAMRGALRDICEAHACGLMLSGAAVRRIDKSEYYELAFGLPLLKEPDLGLSLAVKSYLDELLNDQAKRANVVAWFPQVLDFESNLQKAWKIWGAVNAGVQAAETSVFKAETKRLFKDTNDWLQQKLAGAPAINGSA